MDISIYAMSFILAFARIASFLFILPFLKARFIPTSVKFIVGAGLAIPVMGVFYQVEYSNLLDVVELIFIQVMIGLLLAFTVEMMWSAIRIAGSLIDQDIGFGSFQIGDPSSGSSSTLASNVFNYLFLVVFITMNGIDHLASVIVSSFQFGVGDYSLGKRETIDFLMDIFLFMMQSGIQLALPVILASFVLNIVFLILGNVAPKMNIFLNLFGSKTVMGFLMIMIMLPYLGDFFANYHDVMIERLIENVKFIMTGVD